MPMVAHLNTDRRRKHCSVCHEVFPRTSEYFYRDKHSCDGLRYTCKECDRIRGKLRRKHERHAKPVDLTIFMGPSENNLCSDCLWLHACRVNVKHPEFKMPCFKESSMYEQFVEMYPELLKWRVNA